MEENKTHHLVLIPTPGMGHLIPLVELAKRILNAHPFTISFLILHEGSQTRTKSVLGALPEGRVDSYFLPQVNLDDLSPDTKIETRISLALARSRPAIRDHLRGLQAMPHIHLAAVVVDLFGTDMFDVAFEFGMKPYLFMPSNAMFISFMLHLPKLDSQVKTEYREMDDLIKLPGCVALHGKDLVDPAQDRTNDAYKWLLHHAKKYTLAEGIMVNSFNELEKDTLNVLQNPEPGFPPVYPVGPLIRTDGSDQVDGSGCLAWLDKQPRGSVLFVSFGSGGTLSYDQLDELAHGLEISEQRFLWVVRPPNDKMANGAYFTNEVERDPLHFLPKGFLERTKGRGLVVRDWAPQVQVLNHESTGGFICHCGWNSVLESVVHGVPLIAWPLYAEQKMNAVMLVEGLKIALRPKADEGTVIGRVAIATAVKGLMEGEEGKQVRYRMKELKDASARVLGVEGSSTKALSEVARKWTSH
ncbi:hydroquinone glucosyltransferase-like [Silene latifolia]|uniref:hydroquinone glucosyltransferase-like n=1 Tax=Silene latifolia TaxID=37657 RepID=UPI003D77D720